MNQFNKQCTELINCVFIRTCRVQYPHIGVYLRDNDEIFTFRLKLYNTPPLGK